MQPTLLEYFDYTPMRVDFIVVCSVPMAGRLEHRFLSDNSAIENFESFEYVEPSVNTTRMKKLKRKVIVCFIQYRDGFLDTMNKMNSTELAGMPVGDKYEADTIVKLTGEYPVYLKDRDGYARSATGKSAVDVFNADMNKWLKHAASR